MILHQNALTNTLKRTPLRPNPFRESGIKNELDKIADRFLKDQRGQKREQAAHSLRVAKEVYEYTADIRYYLLALMQDDKNRSEFKQIFMREIQEKQVLKNGRLERLKNILFGLVARDLDLLVELDRSPTPMYQKIDNYEAVLRRLHGVEWVRAFTLMDLAKKSLAPDLSHLKGVYRRAGLDISTPKRYGPAIALIYGAIDEITGHCDPEYRRQSECTYGNPLRHALALSLDPEKYFEIRKMLEEMESETTGILGELRLRLMNENGSASEARNLLVDDTKIEIGIKTIANAVLKAMLEKQAEIIGKNGRVSKEHLRAAIRDKVRARGTVETKEDAIQFLQKCCAKLRENGYKIETEPEIRTGNDLREEGSLVLGFAIVRKGGFRVELQARLKRDLMNLELGSMSHISMTAERFRSKFSYPPGVQITLGPQTIQKMVARATVIKAVRNAGENEEGVNFVVRVGLSDRDGNVSEVPYCTYPGAHVADAVSATYSIARRGLEVEMDGSKVQLDTPLKPGKRLLVKTTGSESKLSKDLLEELIEQARDSCTIAQAGAEILIRAIERTQEKAAKSKGKGWS